MTPKSKTKGIKWIEAGKRHSWKNKKDTKDETFVKGKPTKKGFLTLLLLKKIRA
jgi:hypothetical protein